MQNILSGILAQATAMNSDSVMFESESESEATAMNSDSLCNPRHVMSTFSEAREARYLKTGTLDQIYKNSTLQKNTN